MYSVRQSESILPSNECPVKHGTERRVFKAEERGSRGHFPADSEGGHTITRTSVEMGRLTVIFCAVVLMAVIYGGVDGSKYTVRGKNTFVPSFICYQFISFNTVSIPH